ncbi:type II toxin-antitoxin system RelE/ParE family toxin [Amphibiibacter pelophylacis]|uniref:Type II toxin-antitoxin system RelE/ParE family toxin n=1 Tax=Amphibiibacter pelophylacis TaxID=1799477 RepID=A0ACC6NYN9_9BURK
MFIVRQTEEFMAWLDDLKDKRAQVRIALRLRQLEAGHLGDWQPVEGEVSELRVHLGPGYRLYFVRRGRLLVILLNAGNKSSQKRDIHRALRLAAELGEEPS